MNIVLTLFWIAFAVFAGDVLLGKIDILTGGAVHAFLGDRAHFALLALAAALLTAESLRRESRRNGSRLKADDANFNGPQAPSRN